MSDSAKRDHWAALAANIGITPAPEAPAPQTPAKLDVAENAANTEPLASTAVGEPPAPVPPPVAPACVAPPKTKPAPVVQRRLSSDWDRLAADLGIAPLPPPSRPEPVDVPPAAHESAPIVPAPAVVASAACEPAATTETSREVPYLEDDSPRASELWEEGRLECDDPILLDSTEGFGVEQDDEDEAEETGAILLTEQGAGSPSSTSSEGEGGDRSRRRRRRRRGRGRGRRPDESAPAGSVADAPSADAPAAAEAGETIHAEDAGFEILADLETEAGDAPAAEKAPASAAGEPEAGPRRGRRRRRRGRGDRGERGERRESSREDAVADEDGASHPEPDADLAASFEHDEEDLGALGDEEGEVGEISTKWAHRAIPTWEETVGVIVAHNLESRSKNPNVGGPRGRGGARSKSRDRGGRRRSS